MIKPETSGYAPVNGLNMYYEIYGNGNIPLVLIHGGGSTIETTFGNMLPLLSGYGKLIAVELQAHGRTSDRDAAESFEQDADDVTSLLAYLNISKANFTGFSNGGCTAMQVAIRHPEIVNKLIIISGAYKRDGFMAGFFESMQNATLDDMPVLLKEAYLKVTPHKDGLQAMFNKDKERMLTFKDWADTDIKSITSPVLFMVADRDVITVSHTLAMSALIPDARLVVLPGTHSSIIGEAGMPDYGGESLKITTLILKGFLES